MAFRGLVGRLNIGEKIPWPIMAIMFLEQASFVTLFLFFTQRYIPDDRALGVAFAGYVITVFALTKLLAQTPAGWLGDRFGYKTTLVVGFTVSLAATVLMMVTYNPALFLVATAIFALGRAPTGPALNATLANLYDEEDRGKIVAYSNIVNLSAYAVAGLGGFFMLEFVQPRTIFSLSIGLTVAPLLLVLLAVRETSFLVSHKKDPWLVRMGRLPLNELTNPHVMTWGVIVLLVGLGMGLMGPLARSYSHDVLGMELHEVAPYLVLPAALAFFCLIPAGHLADRLGRLRPLVLGLGIGCVALLGISLTSNVWTVMGMTSFLLLSYALTSPAIGAAMMDLTEEHTRGFVLGALATVQGLGGSLGPTLGGRIYESLEPAAVFYVAGAILGGAALLAAAYGSRHLVLALSPVRAQD
ncbi:MAG: MFS transporter [Chloroflexi bacterium]|nr:MFS transporter [Chloroflexota bacterium]